MKNKNIFLFLAVLTSLTSCITTKQTDLLQDIVKDYPIQDAPEDYKLIPGDQLRLAIYTFDENIKTIFAGYMMQQGTTLSGYDGQNIYNDEAGAGNILDVYTDGTVKIPYLGKISVDGLTILEAKERITARFNTFSPDISIDLVLSNRYFSVLGELGYQRVSMQKQRLNIFQALAQSGKINDLGNRKQVYIIRQTGKGSTEYKSFDLRSKDIIDSEYYWVQPNDVLYVPRLNRTFFGQISNFWDIFTLVSGTTATIFGVYYLIDRIK